MKTQRIVGVVLSIFTTIVIGNHYALDTLSLFDVLYSAVLVPLIVSAIIETRILKAFQILAVAGVGVIIALIDPGGRPVGYVILAIVGLYLEVYGLLGKPWWAKGATFLSIYAVIFWMGFGQDTTTWLWAIMCAVIHGAVWLAVRELVEQRRQADRRAEEQRRRADELEKIMLKHKLIAADELLHETVEAAGVLSDEIKRRGDNGPKD